MTKVSAWVSPDQHLEYSRKTDDMIMVLGIMDSIEKEVEGVNVENLSVSNNFKNEKNRGFLPPLKSNPSWSKEAAHLYREICECGKRRFWTKKSDDHEDFQNLLTSSPRTSPDPPSTQNRLDQLFTIVLTTTTILGIIFLFFIRNIDLILK